MFWVPGDVIHEQVEAKGDVCRMKRASCIFLETISLSLFIVLHGLGPREMLFYLAHLPPHPGIWFCSTQTCLSRMPWLSATTGNHCKLPPYVLVHGTKFSIKHALSYTKGGFPSIWHNEIRNLTANLLTEVSMSGLSLNFYPLMVRCSLALHHTLRMGQDGYCC